MFQDKHGIHYYNNEPDSDNDSKKRRGSDFKRSGSNNLDVSMLFFEGFNGIGADDKVAYLSSKI
jgi:hypothetical protein